MLEPCPRALEVGTPRIPLLLDDPVQHGIHDGEARDVTRAHGQVAPDPAPRRQAGRDAPGTRGVARVEGAVARDQGRFDLVASARRARQGCRPHRGEGCHARAAGIASAA